MKSKSCQNCSYHAGTAKIICGNDNSDQYQDHVDGEFVCDQWKENKEPADE